ncbi:MAG TPA: phosphoribosyltransferase family protein [Terriglobales bacterium]|nr:phosphoribosyltransferase family protein [Terriglobales bacterium]
MPLFRDEDEDLEVLPFADRVEAGCVLAGKLAAYSGRHDVMVMGLPRGGVPVASALAGALHLPLNVCVVSKIRFPWNPELAMGALGEDGVQVLDVSLVNGLGLSDRDMQEGTAAAREELEYRQQHYPRGPTEVKLKAKTVILVDDGIATGCSILAAIATFRRKEARVVVAVPVIPASAWNVIRMEADEVISVAQPEVFLAVSQWYQDFTQISDEDVCRLLAKRHDALSHAA